jgi:hypothetical protein
MSQIMKEKWYVITPYHDEEFNWIKKCVDSVRESATKLGDGLFEVRHLLIGDGVHRPEIQSLSSNHLLIIPGARDYGDTPRYLGASYAYSQGAKAISFLDADNWIFQSHLPTIAKHYIETKIPIITTKRAFFDVDGTSLDAVCLTSDGEQFCDTSCLTLFGSAVVLGRLWGEIDDAEHAIDDRVVWHSIKNSGLSRSHTGDITVAYRARSPSYYRDLGEPIPNQLVRDNTEKIRSAVLSFKRRTGVTAELSWRYSIPFDKPQRARKLALALLQKGDYEKAAPILDVLRSQLANDLGVKLAYELIKSNN